MVDWEVPFNRKFIIYDISLESKGGGDEDKLYAFDQFLYKNIRRGNTIIEGIDSDNSQFFWARMGLLKFFDLYKEYLSFNIGITKHFQNSGIKGKQEHEKLHQIIFNEGFDDFRNGGGSQIQIYKTAKANGENAQISYVPQLKSWAISSKNVCIVVRNEEDIDMYPEDKMRFNFAKSIAKQWFRILQKIESSINDGAGKILSLQNDLIGRTLVGEYCGNQKYQHLILYEDIQIYFYAIVDHKSEDTCISVQDSINFFEKYSLQKVKIDNLGIFQNWVEFNQCLENQFDLVASADIDSESEGSVLYFEKQGQKQQVLSLCKLKTLEYRIYRKLREKLRSFINQNKNSGFEQIFQKFKSEVQELCVENNPAKPLVFYHLIAQASFQFANDYKNQAQLIHDQYITFLSVVIHCLDKQIKLEPQLFTENDLKEIMKIPWKTYNIEQIIQKQMGNKHLQIYKNDDLRIQKLYDKQVLVFIPVGIPGMGKTTFKEFLKPQAEQLGYSLIIISSDQIRQQCMFSLMKKNPHLNEDMAFERTNQEAKTKFFETLKTVVKVKSQLEKKTIIFIDKNHPPNSLKLTFKTINENCPSNTDLKKIALLPQHIDQLLEFDRIKYPFTLNFIFNCMERVQNRKEHPTLPGSGPKSLNTMILFINLFQNIYLNDQSLEENGFDLGVRFPFVFEEEDSQKDLPKELVQKLINVLKCTQPGSQCQEDKIFYEFYQEFESSKFYFGVEEKKNLAQEAMNIVQKCHKLFANQNEIQPDQQVSLQNQKIFEILEENQQQVNTTYEKMEIQNDSSQIQQINSQKTEFNPQKIPLYLGVFAKSESEGRLQTFEYIKKQLDILQQKFGNDNQIKETQKQLEQNRVFKFPDSQHITSYFVAGNTQEIYFKDFEENLNFDIIVYGLVLVPNNIITGICFPDQSKIKFQNKCPHLTMMIGKWAAVKSNHILNSLFSENKSPLKQVYSKQFFENKEDKLIEKIEVQVQDEGKQTAYVIKSLQNLKIPGITKACYKIN